jgi:hypothetical protein
VTRFLAIAVLMLGLAALFFLLHRQSNQIAEIRTELQQRNASPEPPLQLQAKCAEQARKVFAEEGYKRGLLTSFENHYSTKLGKCFIEIRDGESTRTSISVSTVLLDAFEDKVYGTYGWSNPKGKKFWEVAPYMCSVTLPSGEKKTCHSEDEFSELIKPYMEGN